MRDRTLHKIAGFAYGIPLRCLSRRKAGEKIWKLDLWAWNREVSQHDTELTPHQIDEAKAWGEGARQSSGVNIRYPSPPYPV